MRDKSDGIPLSTEGSRPPDWLPEAHASADLGYIGYFPPRPGQDEDILTEGSVKNGLTLPSSVSAETWSAQESVKKVLAAGNAMSDLEDLMNQVFARRADAVPTIPTSTFRMPSRATLSEAKRQAWFTDLANSEVPLHKLGKSVPHGAKGLELLELLHSNNVAIPRALWYVRVLGANEMTGLRNKPGYDPTQYSVEWANVITAYLRKQLGEINLPSAPRPGLNIKSTFRRILSDTKTREQWISRFSYCVSLLRSFYSEGLVDNRTFLSWLVLQMGTCNLAQACFLGRLSDEYLEGILTCRALAHPFAEACVLKMTEIQASDVSHLPNLEYMMKMFLRRICLVLPDALLSPRMWSKHSSLLRVMLAYDCEEGSSEVCKHYVQQLNDNFMDIANRNDAMLFRNLPPRVLARLSEAVHLNSISINTDFEVFYFFDPQWTDAQLSSKVDRLLTWSVTPLQYGDHRPYAAVTLLRKWCDRAEDRATRRDYTSPTELLQDLLFDWLDTRPVAGEAQNLEAVALLFGWLVKSELFSYALYVQRLIARCEPGLQSSDEGGSRHRNFLRWIPLYKSNAATINQRKVTLHGVRARETPEDANEREMRREVRTLLPELFSDSIDAIPLVHPMPLSFYNCATLTSAPRYERVRTVRQWLLPLLTKNLPSRLNNTLLSPYAAGTYSTAVAIMAQLKCHGSILDLSLKMLDHKLPPDFLTVVLETFRLFHEIWASMNVMKSITEALYRNQQLYKMSGSQAQDLRKLVLKFDNGRYLDAAARKHVESEVTAYAQALCPADSNPEVVPTHLQEILLLPNDPRPDAASSLANNLWYRYRAASDWAWRVWDNTFASLRIQPQVPSDIVASRARALCYADFLLHIDKHLPNGLDEHVFRWLTGPGLAELIAIDADAWNSVTTALIHLAAQGALSTTTILEGLVYPLWRLSLQAVTGVTGQTIQQPPEVYLRAAHDHFARLLLHDRGSEEGVPPITLIDYQRIRTHRLAVFQEPHLSQLVANIPTLVFLEHSHHIPEDLRQLSATLRHAICEVTDFRQGIYRDLTAVRQAFERCLQYDTLDETLVEPIMDALRLILNVARTDSASLGSCEWLDTSALLSPWKLAATTIEVQFALKQMGERLALGTPHTHGNTKVDKLIAQFLHHHMSTEEADFVAEMARGVGPTIVSKFVNMGLWNIAGVLNGAPSPLGRQGLREILDVASEQLRLLAHVVEPDREDQLQPPCIDASTQDEFFVAITNKMGAFEVLVSPQGSTNSDIPPEEATKGAILMARLLQFNLGFQGVWTPKVREQSSRLCGSIFRLALAHAAGDFLDPVAFPLFLDTFCYLLDEITADTKLGVTDIFRNYPQLNLRDLPPDMPAEYRQQLRALLPYSSPNESTMDLAYAFSDANGQTVIGAPVTNRPWEWAENLGDVAVPDPKEDAQPEDRHRGSPPTVKNSASLPLELFTARATGDPLASVMAQDDPRTEATVRSFHDSLSSDTVFARDWRETRTNLNSEVVIGASHMRSEEDDEVGALPSFPSHEQKVSRRPSPTSSIRSRGSARMSAGSSSRRPSPAQAAFSRASGSTAGDAIDVEMIGTSSTTSRRSSKRKASVSTGSDDIEIIEGPVPAPAKKPKAKPAAKPRSKRR
ncbi:hypothetical protein EVG20_g5379 [Dentipellis fragilis]|uniref:Mediator of RNA polymerase II transcription subunit 12 n=1 Tax=Dentipellis fragilis TaxID=205917 RepID=A0A4Y9YVE8_9AGAM|nr:hypothetical protein EVG20_g5379 [Dentipellis fragilis]